MPTYDPNVLESLHRKCHAHGNPHTKGRALEDFVEHVLIAVPSVVLIARDVKDDAGAQEIDLALSHFYPLSRIPIPDVTILVECKNENKKTSSEQVTRFASKLRSRVLPLGILVSRRGLAGSQRSHAHAAIRDELTSGTAIIVVRVDELAALSDTDDLAILLTDRLNELRTYRGYATI